MLLRQMSEEGICTLTLNRPDVRNALSLAMLRALRDALADCAADSAVRVVVLAAAGPVFCSGHDLKEVRQMTADQIADLFDLCSEVMMAVTRLPKPVIAQVHATATAAGCQLVASCDLAYATTTARFATPGVNIGLFCSTPMVALSRAVPRKAAMEMLLTGEPISAEHALSVGLLNAVVPDEAALAEKVQAVARRIASKSAVPLEMGKEAFYQQIDLPLADAYRLASAVMTRNMAAEDAREGIDAFLQKRSACWVGR